MGGDQLGHDRQAEAAAAVIAGTGVVQAHEPLEHPLPVGLGDAGAVVVDQEADHAVALGHRERHLGAGVAGGVVAQVAQDPPQTGGVAVDPAGRHGAGVDPQAGDAPQPPGLVEHQVVEVDRASAEPEGVLVGPGEQQQVLGQALEPEVLGQHRPGQLGGAGPVRWARATSACWRMAATGERSSWEASETSRR